MPFKILWENGKLILQPDVLAHERRVYLENTLTKINHHKKIGFFGGSPVYSLYQPPPATPAGIRSLEHRLLRRFEGQRIPATATLSITRACQCACAHCSAIYYNKSPRRVLSKREFQSAIEQTMELGVTTLILLGGEPLLRQDLCELVSSVSPDKASVILFTNGEFLTPVQCKQLEQAGLMGAFVSLDSPVEEEHDQWRHRRGLFKRALIGIENMQRANLLVGISSYLDHNRLKEGLFERMMDLGKKMEVHEVTFFDAIPTGRWLRDHSIGLSVEDRTEIQRLTNLYRKKPGHPGLSVQSTLTSSCGSAFCFAANTQFYLTAFGDMCPCDFTPLTVGQFPEKSIQELWEKMVHTPPYHERAKSCRMQDPHFRAQYIHPIPLKGPYPYPLQALQT